MKKLKTYELGRLSVKEYQRMPKMPVVIILDNIRSMHNTGSVFRTADAFLAEKIFLCGITAQPPHREIHKTALGATESVEWKYFDKVTSALEVLKKEDYAIFAVEQANPSILLDDIFDNGSPHKKYALVFGNEVNGVSEDVLPYVEHCLEIPQSGTKHSLNVAVSAGIVLWEFYQYLTRL